MTYIIRICICIYLCFPIYAQAKPLVADIDKRQIKIHSGFVGTDLLLFGARYDVGDIVVVVRGPSADYTVRKKQNIGGIWINRNQITFKDVPGFYAIASSRPLSVIKNDYLLKDLEIGINNLSINYETPRKPSLIPEFKQALIEAKQQETLYPESIHYEKVSFIGDNLFRTIIRFPETIPRGVYTANIYLFADGRLTSVQTTPIEVKKTGLDAFIYDAAYNYPALYGIVAIFIALLAGFLANIVLRR